MTSSRYEIGPNGLLVKKAKKKSKPRYCKPSEYAGGLFDNAQVQRGRSGESNTVDPTKTQARPSPSENPGLDITPER